MWFILSLIALLCWSGSDLFSKIGCADAQDKRSPLKMVLAVGIVMGLHALYELTLGGASLTFADVLTYLPVSALYISSMAIGYLGLRYIELSVSSPICNSSGALVAILTLAVFGLGEISPWQLVAVGLVVVGVVALGFVEAGEDEDLRRARQEKGNYKYAKSWLAIGLPVIYCLLDALGGFADSIVLQKLEESSANAAYELTFLFVGLCCGVVLLLKREKPSFKRAWPRFTGAIFETAGQFAYIYAMADTEHVALAAPVISAYCAASVLWGRIFLKEKLSFKHYLCIATIVVGIVILGILDA